MQQWSFYSVDALIIWQKDVVKYDDLSGPGFTQLSRFKYNPLAFKAVILTSTDDGELGSNEHFFLYEFDFSNFNVHLLIQYPIFEDNRISDSAVDIVITIDGGVFVLTKQGSVRIFKPIYLDKQYIKFERQKDVKNSTYLGVRLEDYKNAEFTFLQCSYRQSKNLGFFFVAINMKVDNKTTPIYQVYHVIRKTDI